MEFTEFAQIIKPIIGGATNTALFTRTLFEEILTGEGVLLIEETNESTLKAYFNGKTKITKIAQRIADHIPKLVTENYAFNYDFQLLECSIDDETSVIRFDVHKLESIDDDIEEQGYKSVVPFQVTYAVSIHKVQGLEYNSVKLVITDEVEKLVTHNVFYTAITQAREKLKIYWTPKVEEKVINRIKPRDISKEVEILKNYLNGYGG